MTRNGHGDSRVLVIEPRGALAALVVDRLNAIPGVEAVRAAAVDGGGAAAVAVAAGPVDALVYSPLDPRARDLAPDLTEAGAVLAACARSGVRKVVLLSSAAAYGADYHNPGLIRESRPAQVRRPNRVAGAWRAVESLA